MNFNIKTGSFNLGLSSLEQKALKSLTFFTLGTLTVKVLGAFFRAWDVVIEFLNFVIWG